MIYRGAILRRFAPREITMEDDMTTTVRVDAMHGCPVEIDGVARSSRDVLWTREVPAGQSVTVHAHNGMDILVRELGPQDISEVPSPAQPE